MQILREHIHPNYFPVEQGHSVPHKVWRDLFLKVFNGRWGTSFGRQIYWGAVLHGGLMIRSSCQGQRISPWGSKWGLPWGSLCGTSGKGKLCLVPCQVCHIYGIWRSRSEGHFEIIWGWQCKPQEGSAVLMGKGDGDLTVCNTAVLRLCYWVL